MKTRQIYTYQSFLKIGVHQFGNKSYSAPRPAASLEILPGKKKNGSSNRHNKI